MSESTTGTLLGGEAPPPGGGAADTREWLPEEYRGNPLFADFKDPGMVFKSYENAARLVGVDKAEVLRLPKDSAAAEWADVWGKLGRPDTPDKYELKGPDGLPPDVLTGLAKVMHDTGLSKTQAERIMGFYGETVQTSAAQAAAARDAEFTQVESALRQEWGKAFDDQLHAAKRAVTEIGGPEISALLVSTGLGNNPAVIKMFAKLGAAQAEPSGLKGGGGGEYGGGTLTPAAAQAEIKRLQGDRAFSEKMKVRGSGDYNEAMATWDRLHQMAYPKEDA